MINSCSCSLYTYINNEISPYVKIVRIYMRSYTFDFVPWCFLTSQFNGVHANPNFLIYFPRFPNNQTLIQYIKK